MMPDLEIDPSIERVIAQGLHFPLGLKPLEQIAPVSGYVVEFESADGGDGDSLSTGDADWEEWPDRFMFDVLLDARRVPAFCKAVFSLFPGRLYPILDILGNDAYREIDPYIAYDLVGVEQFWDAVMRYEKWMFEDGLVGFGAMSTDPFVYAFVDEHKAVTIRVGLDDKERVEKLLAAFDLTEVNEIVGADAVAHEHRSILASVNQPLSSEGNARVSLTPEEIIERLRDDWALQLNIDPTSNTDEDGSPLGRTAWRCVVRASPDEDHRRTYYAEVLLASDSLESAEAMAGDTASANAPEGLSWAHLSVTSSDRLTPELLDKLVNNKAEERRELPSEYTADQIFDLRWYAPSREEVSSASHEPTDAELDEIEESEEL